MDVGSVGGSPQNVADLVCLGEGVEVSGGGRIAGCVGRASRRLTGSSLRSAVCGKCGDPLLRGARTTLGELTCGG